MKKFMNPEMNISKFSVIDIVTTSGGTGEDPQTPVLNTKNAENYLKDKNIATSNILNFQ